MSKVPKTSGTELATKIVPPRRCWNPTTQLVTLVSAPILAAGLGFAAGMVFASGAAIGIAVLSGSLALFVAANLIKWIKIPTETTAKVDQAWPKLVQNNFNGTFMGLEVARPLETFDTIRKLIENPESEIAQIDVGIGKLTITKVNDYLLLLNEVHQKARRLIIMIKFRAPETGENSKLNNEIARYEHIRNKLIEKLATTHWIKDQSLLIPVCQLNFSLIPHLIKAGAIVSADFWKYLLTQEHSQRMMAVIYKTVGGNDLLCKLQMDIMKSNPPNSPEYGQALTHLKLFLSLYKAAYRHDNYRHLLEYAQELNNNEAIKTIQSYLNFEESNQKINFDQAVTNIETALLFTAPDFDPVMMETLTEHLEINTGNFERWIDLMMRVAQTREKIDNTIDSQDSIVRHFTYKIPDELITDSRILLAALKYRAYKTLFNMIGGRIEEIWGEGLRTLQEKRYPKLAPQINAEFLNQMVASPDFSQISDGIIKAGKGEELLRVAFHEMSNGTDKTFERILEHLEEILIVCRSQRMDLGFIEELYKQFEKHPERVDRIKSAIAGSLLETHESKTV